MKYQVGQLVQLAGSYRGGNIYEIIDTKQEEGIRLYSLRMENGIPKWFQENKLSDITPSNCPICGCRVKVEKNKISEHHVNERVCCGSFMPLFVKLSVSNT